MTTAPAGCAGFELREGVAGVRPILDRVRALGRYDGQRAIAFGAGQAYGVGRAEAYKGNSGSYTKSIGRFVIGRGYRKIINPSSTWSASSDKSKSVSGFAKAVVSCMTAAFENQCRPIGVRVKAIASVAMPAPNTIRGRRRNPELAKRMFCRVKLGQFARPSDTVGALIFLQGSQSSL